MKGIREEKRSAGWDRPRKQQGRLPRPSVRQVFDDSF